MLIYSGTLFVLLCICSWQNYKLERERETLEWLLEHKRLEHERLWRIEAGAGCPYCFNKPAEPQ